MKISNFKFQINNDIPKQYIQGWVEFYKLRFKVTPDVLIPRLETELLVDEVLNSIKNYELSIKGRIVVLDIGTGSGNIAISIAKNTSNINVFATDISEEALEIAKENARLNKVDKRIFFLQSDLLSAFNNSPSDVRYDRLDYHTKNIPDIIVTNLPYIPSSRIPYLDSSVKDSEPRVALDGGPDGFELYRKLFDQIRHKFLQEVEGVNLDHLEGGLDWHPPSMQRLKLIVCEIDYTHGELALTEAQKYFPKAKVEVKTDLAQKQRILVIKFLPNHQHS